MHDQWKNPITGVNQTDGYNNMTSAQMQTIRETGLKIYFCPSRRSPPQLVGFDASNAVMGSASDYAGCTGDGANDGSFQVGMIPIVVAGSSMQGIGFAKVTDGLSNTLMIGEKHVAKSDLNNPATSYTRDGVIWSGGEQGASVRRAGAANPLAQDINAVYNNQFGSYHTSVVQFAMGDGSIRGIRTSVPGSTLALLSNIKDGLPIPSFD
jgi:hypothetical protein